MRLLFPTALVATAALACVSAPAALADTSQSSNWAGYAVHRPGVSFTKVIGAWRQPDATCTPGNPSYSAVWVGLGGYSVTSNALEQIGTEIDCTVSGKVSSSAWYEVVPAASQTIKLIVHPGDQLKASVSVVGHKVQLSLNDTTRYRSFVKNLHASVIDIASAEWIVEAPSTCVSSNSCQTLPLANFGSTKFGLASATSTSGHTGSIANRAWSSTEISLAPVSRHFIDFRGPGAVLGSASPSTLTSSGSSFKVTYHGTSVQNNPTFAKRNALPRDGQVVHVGQARR
jgi:Peptidase A4 family